MTELVTVRRYRTVIKDAQPKPETIAKIDNLLFRIKTLLDVGHSKESAWKIAFKELKLSQTYCCLRKDIINLDFSTPKYKEAVGTLAAVYSQYVKDANEKSKARKAYTSTNTQSEAPATPEEATLFPPSEMEEEKTQSVLEKTVTQTSTMDVLNFFKQIQQEMEAKDMKIQSLEAQVAALKKSNAEFENIVLNFSAAFESMNKTLAECQTKNNAI